MYNLEHMSIGALTTTPESEFSSRRGRVMVTLAEKRLEAMIFFSASSIFYLTGSSLFQTERPMVYVLKTGGEQTILVPRLELEHAQNNTRSLNAVCYPEYPGERHPMEYLRDLLADMGLSGAAVAADAPGYPGVSGYEGPSLADVAPDMQVTFLPRLITQMKIIKSPFEITLMKESARWGNLAHVLLQEYTKPGLTELDVVGRANNDATAIMLKTLGPGYHMSGLDGNGVYTGYRGQIGPHSYFPHSATINAVFQPGDTLVTGAGATILGYGSELERVMFVGEPSKEQEKYFHFAVEAQNAAFSMIKPGARCSDVDGAMLEFFKENNLQHTWRHHTGHSIGTGGHEAPFFDIGDHTVIEPGMCFTVEPGIYVEGLGGFRLSDTLVVTETGFELITYYPREIDKLICQ